MRVLAIISWMVVSAAVALSQDSVAAGSATNVKGCLSGDAGSYTLTEEQTGNAFSIAGSAVDLKPHLGHEVELIAQVIGGDGGNRSIRVKELKMISEHCSPAAMTGGSPAVVASNSNPSVSDATGPSASSASATPLASSAPASRKVKHMPNTASPLPLLGALGLAFVLAGLASLKKRQIYL